MHAIYEREMRQGTATFETDPPDFAELGARLAKVQAAGLPWLLAELDGIIAG
jgi:L-amino acid N-acyltransferase YncA